MKQELISYKRKALICTALKQLLRRKSIQRITIQELADECDISRYTFYYHFADIYDCLSWMLQEELRTLLRREGSQLELNSLLTCFIQFIRENRPIIQQLQSSPNPNLLHRFFQQEIPPLIRLHLAAALEHSGCRIEPSYCDFLCQFLSSALAGLLFTWDHSASGCSSEQLDAYLHTLLDGHFAHILHLAEQQGFCTRDDPTTHAAPEDSPHPWNCLL